MQYSSIKDRKSLHPNNFGDPDRLLFPVMTQDDVNKAPSRLRRSKGKKEVAHRIVDIATRKGFIIPTEWRGLGGLINSGKVNDPDNDGDVDQVGVADDDEVTHSSEILVSNYSATGRFENIDYNKLSFSSLNRTEREKLPKSDFGDPERLLFPIMDQSDVKAAARLIGKAHNPDAVKARIIAIAKRKGFDLPKAWQ